MRALLISLLVFISGMTLGFAQLGTITKGKVQSDSVRLRTRLVLPENPLRSRPPVLIIVHGSGNKGSWNTYLPMVSRFSEQGFAVVFYDKRGTGESEGSYQEVSAENSIEVFERLSNDVIAVAEWTKKQARVDTTRIGVLGYSEGGWVAPLAVHKSPLLKFAVILSGPICSVGQELLYTELTEAATEEEALPKDAIFSSMEQLEREQGFDSYDYITAMKVPGFWLFGEADDSMAVEFSLGKLKEIMVEDTLNLLEYKIYKGANHSLYEAKTKERMPYALDIRAWALQRLYPR